MTVLQIGKRISPVKVELDRLELVERVPALWRENSEWDENGVLVLPRHPAVIAYVNECAAKKRPNATLRSARNRYERAFFDYKDRRAFRVQRGIRWDDGGEFVKLSAIIEARAESLYWCKMIRKLELAQKHRWNVARSHVTAI
jgi:hypothetical protein